MFDLHTVLETLSVTNCDNILHILYSAGNSTPAFSDILIFL